MSIVSTNKDKSTCVVCCRRFSLQFSTTVSNNTIDLSTRRLVTSSSTTRQEATRLPVVSLSCHVAGRHRQGSADSIEARCYNRISWDLFTSCRKLSSSDTSLPPYSRVASIRVAECQPCLQRLFVVEESSRTSALRYVSTWLKLEIIILPGICTGNKLSGIFSMTRRHVAYEETAKQINRHSYGEIEEN